MGIARCVPVAAALTAGKHQPRPGAPGLVQLAQGLPVRAHLAEALPVEPPLPVGHQAGRKPGDWGAEQLLPEPLHPWEAG